MSGRDTRIRSEAAALWTQLHGEPAPEGADGATLLDRILGELPATPYERLTDPYLRPANIAFPQYDKRPD